VGAVDAADSELVVEHLDALDHLLVVHAHRVQRVDPPDGSSLPRPLDPLTPVSVVEAVPEGEAVAVGDGAHDLVDAARLLTAAFQVGLAQAAVDLGTSYAGDRRQFGKVIGTFQAVKHLLADAAVAVD